jgi:hypothetical protein
MTMQRLKSLLSLLAIAILLTGCPDDPKSVMLIDDVDVATCLDADCFVEIDDVDVPDILEDEIDPFEWETEAEIFDCVGCDCLDCFEEEITPPEPEISFCVTTASGCESEFADCLTLADDQYPGIAGLQVNINVTSANIAQGTEVELWIDGILVDPINKPADEFSFNQVTLTHKVDGHTLEVRVPGIVNSQLSLCVETGDCGITVEPSNEDCAAGDADEDAAGYQLAFTVTADGTDCDEAWLEIAGEAFPAVPQELVDGEAEFVATLVADDSPLTCSSVEVSAFVGDSNNPERNASLGPFDFTVDDTQPLVTLLQPSSDSVNLLLDEDLDLAGIQVTVSGTLDEIASDDVVQLLVNDEEAGLTTAGAGNFSFVATLASAGPHTLEVVVTDCCNNVGSATKVLIAVFSDSDLSIAAPGADATLLALDNGPDGTATAYDIDFTILAPICEVDDVITVECRTDGGALYTFVGQTQITSLDDEWLYAVPVTLDTEALGNGILCRAKVTKEGTLVSDAIGLTVGLPAPQLVLTAPGDGDLIDPTMLAVSGSAANLIGQDVTVTLAGNAAQDWTTTASGTGFLLEVTAEELPEGIYDLSVEATDIYGNVASEQEGSMTTVQVVLDSEAPLLSFIAPTDGDTCTPPACVDTVDNGIVPGHQLQIVLLVDGEADPEGVEVCLTANDVPQLPCATPAEKGGQWEATFFGVTLLTGSNELVATAVDSLGHKTEDVVAFVTLDVDAPRVTFDVPSKDLVTGSEPVSVVVAVSSPDGSVDHADAAVTLFVAGEEYDTSSAGPGGQYTFSVSGLTPNVPTLLQAGATHGTYANAGYSDVRKATLKDTLPGINIISPADNAVLNVAALGCAPGVDGCKLNVGCTTTNVEDGQEATVTASCGDAGEVVVSADVGSNLVTFIGVALPNNATCVLVATVTDAVGQEASSAAITLTIDRTAPTAEFTFPETALVKAAKDLDADADGFQYVVGVKIAGLESGQEVALGIAPEEGAADDIAVTLDGDISDGGGKNIFFAEYDYVGGLNTLTVTLTDLAGNTAKTTKDFVFFTDPTEISFYQYETVEFKACADSGECGAGVCAEVAAGMRCVTPWNDSKQVMTVITTPGPLFEGKDKLRFCSNHGSLTTEVCNDASQGEYRILKTVDLIGGFEGITFSKVDVEGLAQGEHRIFVEAQSNGDGTWFSSQASASFDERFRVLYIDTEAPAIDAVAFPGDAQPEDGWLNILEAVANATFTVGVTVSGAEGGSTTLSINNLTQPAVTVPAGVSAQLGIDLDFSQGPNDVCATAKDLVGNFSSEVCESINVDTESPPISFTYPQGSAVLLEGSSADVKLTTESNHTVTLTVLKDGVGSELTADANLQGNVTFTGALADDATYVLAATTADSAGNSSDAVTSPAEVVVDRTAPTLELTVPTAGTALAAEDDAAATGGFQVEVQFTSGGGDAWDVTTQRCPDNTYTNCEGEVLKTQGTEQGAQSTLITLGKLFSAIEYRIIAVTVTNSVGNETSEQTTISVAQGDCIVVFTNLPATDFINNSYCAVAGTDCATVEIDAEVSVTGACGDGDLLVFYKDDVPAAQSADFAMGPVTFPVTVADSGDITVEAKLLKEGAETGFGTGEFGYTADLTDPIPAFVSPADDPFLCNVAADENGGADGCQFTAEIGVTGDNLMGGTAALVRTLDGAEVSLSELDIDAAPFAATVGGLTLPEAADQALVLRASDLAGNQAEVSIAASADVTAPAAITLNEIDPDQDINRRRPSVRLTWSAVGDDAMTGGAAATYEFRYSDTPITGDADFEAACDTLLIAGTDAADSPGLPGTLESFDITGPDTRDAEDPCHFVMSPIPDKQFWFAVRAVDEAGNSSEVQAESIETTTALSLQYSQISNAGLGAPAMGAWVYDLGDLNGDDMNEFALSGDTSFSGFCIVKGHTNIAAEIVLADADTDPNIECVKDTENSWEGFQISPLGDINGDGINDIGSKVYKNTDGEWNTNYRIYLGDGNGFVEEPPAVNISFTGVDYYTGDVNAAGNFNGDVAQGGQPLFDIAVGAPDINKVFIVPGNAVWKSSAPVTIDLLDADDLDAWNVLAIEGTGMAGRWFGDSVASLGNVIPDNGATQYDDISISMTKEASSVFVIKGRAISQSGSTTVSLDLDGSGAEDAGSVKLRPDAGQGASYQFGDTVEGNRDITGDGVNDLLVSHYVYAVTANTQVYVFSGAAVAAGLGTTVRVMATGDAGHGVSLGTNGLRIKTSGSYFALAGNFDNEASDGGESFDLVYTDFLTDPELGHVYVRLNHQDDAVDGNYYPHTDVVIMDPFTPDNFDFGGYNFRPVGDMNGDGMPDLVVGNKLLGYTVVVH